MTTTNEAGGPQVWRTRSNIQWTNVTGPSVSACLVQLARVLDDFDLEPFVTHLHMSIEDDEIVVSALTEKVER